MRDAAADLDFEEAARLRDELKRLQATELVLPTIPSPARATWSARPAASAAAASTAAPPTCPRRRAPPPRAGADRAHGPTRRPLRRGHPVRKPTLDEMGPGTDREVPLTWKARPWGGDEGPAGERRKNKGVEGRGRGDLDSMWAAFGPPRRLPSLPEAPGPTGRHIASANSSPHSDPSHQIVDAQATT